MRPVLHYCCWLRWGNFAEAEDLAQEVFVAACERWDQFQPRGHVLSWLYEIARRQSKRADRLAYPRALCFEEDLAGFAAPDDVAATAIEQIELDRAINSLSEPLWQVVLLVKVQELTINEAARALGIPPGTVHSWLDAAAKKLRSLLATESPEPAEPGPGEAAAAPLLPRAPRRRQAGAP